MKVLYSTCPTWQAGVNTLEEVIQQDNENLEKYSDDSFRDACEAIIHAKPLYEHPGHQYVIKGK